MAAITMITKEQLMRIRLVVFDFDGVLTDNMVHVDMHGREFVTCSRSDGLGIKRIQSIDVMTLILSTETNPVVSKRAKKIGVQCIQGSINKLDDLQAFCKSLAIDLINVAYVGNDINDISVMQHVGLSVSVSDAYQEVKDISDICLSRKGGYGAVREFCDMIYSGLILT